VLIVNEVTNDSSLSYYTYQRISIAWK